MASDLKTLAYNLKDKNSLRKLFGSLNFSYCDDAVNRSSLLTDDNLTIEDSEIIAQKNNYKIYYIKSYTDSQQLKSIAAKIIKSNLGMCLVCTHTQNPDGLKWIFSILSNTFSDSFNEIRHLPLEIPTASKPPDSFVAFLKKIDVLHASTADAVRASISAAFDSFAVQIHDELTINVFEALETLSNDIIHSNNLPVTDETLAKIREPIFIFLYRIIFVLYAESRSIFPINDHVYREKFSMEHIKSEWILKPPSNLPEGSVLRRLRDLFKLIEMGSESLNYDKNEFFMPSYYGRLFDRDIHVDLERWKMSNKNLLIVLNLLTRTHDKHGHYLLDYQALETRHLGSIYERILEYQLTVSKGVITSSDDLRERKTSGSYYTPKLIVDHIVENTIEPLITSIINNVSGKKFQIKKILELKILDPAMGSGHFLVSAANYIATRICKIEGNYDERNYIERKREVVSRCIYGVDMNALVVDLAMVTLWLETLASEKPLSFLSAHLKHGNSLVGSSMASIFGEQITLTESEQGRKYLKDSVRAFLEFESEDNTPMVVKTKTSKYRSMRTKGTPYHDLKILLDCQTSTSFGNEVLALGDYRAKIPVQAITGQR